MNDTWQPEIGFWLSCLGRPNTEIRRHLFQSFGHATEIWKASVRRTGAGFLRQYPAAQQRFMDPAVRAYATDTIKKAKKSGMKFTAPDAPDYPVLLREIPDPPGFLFYYGTLPQKRCNLAALLGVVGTRNASSYGLSAASRFCTSLSQCGIGIVSGLARGIDGEAHRSTLQKGGYTIAVLGCGADLIYPSEHRELYRAIRERGCILSEYPPAVPPQKQHFPARNRIIAGLSAGTLVVEAAGKSGALITADRALEYNRNVYAIPGSIFSSGSAGTHFLIKEGAQCVTDPDEIRTDLGLPAVSSAESDTESETERRFLFFLTQNGGNPEILAKKSGLTPAETMRLLTELELKKRIRRGKDGLYFVLS